MNPPPKVIIAYTEYEPPAVNNGERMSEESLLEMARQVEAAVQALGWPVPLFLQRAF
jgi:hypothetical protein